MTKYQSQELSEFDAFLMRHQQEGMPRVSTSENISLLQAKYERYGVNTSDVVHLLRRYEHIEKHLTSMGGILFEVHGKSINGENMVVVCCCDRDLDAVKVCNTWLK